MHLVEIVAALAVLQYLLFIVFVGRARIKYGIKAPAVAGHEMFERNYRVQMNTLELLVMFLPLLLLAGRHWPEGIVAVIGFVYLIGRFFYRHLYLADPAGRAPGFILSMLPILVLLVLALLGGFMP